MCEYFDLYLHCPRCHKNTPEQKVEVALCDLAKHLKALVKKNGGICDDLKTRHLTGVYVEHELCEQCKNLPKFKDSSHEIKIFFAQLWRQHRETEKDLEKRHGPRKEKRQRLEISEDGESITI